MSTIDSYESLVNDQLIKFTVLSYVILQFQMVRAENRVRREREIRFGPLRTEERSGLRASEFLAYPGLLPLFIVPLR